MNEKRFTPSEIYTLFRDSNLNEDFKSEVLTRFDALCQGMYNAVSDPQKTMTVENTHSDKWVEEHNRVVTEYQRYYK